jgi:probable HAF family extracellular repeat protein
VLQHRSNADIVAVVQVQDQAGSLFNSLRQTGGDDAARNAVVIFLKQQLGVVADAGVSADGHTVWIAFADGTTGFILGSPAETQGGGPRRYNKRLPQRTMPIPPVACALALIGQEQAIVWAPFFSEFFSVAGDASVDIGTRFLPNTCAGRTPAITDQNATVDSMRNINTFSFIYINTHGYVDNVGNVEISTGEVSTVASQKAHEFDIQMGWVKWATAPDQNDYLTLTPQFFRYYGRHGFPNSIVFVSACESLGANGLPLNTTLSDTFLSNGGATFLGWNNSVHTAFTYAVSEQLYSTFTNMSLAASARTIGVTFDSLPSGRVDTPAPGQAIDAQLYLLGDRNRTLCKTSQLTYTLTPLPMPAGANQMYPYWINNAGDVAGDLVAGLNYPFFWSQTGGLQSLSSTGGRTGGINNAGQVVGSIPSSTAYFTDAFVWSSSSGLLDLKSKIAALSSGGGGINDGGWIVGPYFTSSTGALVFVLHGDNTVQFLSGDQGYGINNSDQVLLRTSGHQALVDQTGISNFTFDSLNVPHLNNSGQVVGSYSSGFPAASAFVWSKIGGLQTLGSLFSGCNATYANGINNLGQIVGSSAPCDFSSQKPVLWKNGTTVDLTTLIAPVSGWQVIAADAINDNGYIAGHGWYNGVVRAFLLIPN